MSDTKEYVIDHRLSLADTSKNHNEYISMVISELYEKICEQILR
jgi:hypothetical protein